MKNMEHNIEFNIIKEKLIALTYTAAAKKMITALEPSLSETEVSKKLKETSEAKHMIEKAGNPPMTQTNDLGELLDIACKGGCLTAVQLEGVIDSLTGVKRLKDYLNQCKVYTLSLPYYEENLDYLPEIREELLSKIKNERVIDSASALLKSLRNQIGKLEQKMREKAEHTIGSHKKYMSDNFSTIRNGHICIPIKKEYKGKIPGSVIDSSSTGNTLFIEPAAVSKYYEELILLELEEENEVRRILYTLSSMIADATDIIRQNNRTIEKLDFIFAKGKLSMEYDGCQPSINTCRNIKLINGRHPLMDRDVAVPLNFQIGEKVNGIIITGPNTGGKTVAIKTVALNCMMAQCGLHVACEEADICINSNFLCDIGDGQNISENLSTFSSHITNVLSILKKADRNSLIIMDELGSGTDPTEGMGIAIAVLDELKKSGALYLVTTHYPEVKSYAQQEDGMVNARMTFDKESLKPLYQLVIGEAGESCAFYIAGKLGMPNHMLKKASLAAYGKETTDINSTVRDDAFSYRNNKKIEKKKTSRTQQKEALKFQLGDSVMIYPDKKTGIICETANDKGALRVQLPDKKIWINHKRVKLLVAATELYPEDYDFSIIFDSVEHRKARHTMERKHVEDLSISYNNIADS